MKQMAEGSVRGRECSEVASGKEGRKEVV